MKNNIIIKKINIVLSVLFLYSCIDQMQDAGDAKKVTPVRGTVTIQVNTGFVTKAGDPGFPTEGLRACSIILARILQRKELWMKEELYLSTV